ncbi:hypothetical protein [Legionella longbeachae]|uniref:Uncharacterized protein n=1 Tax=Legionella longbeachae serogroup 1 (strain NSW150) TaxID=661367 RepID=D3HMY8_LEGLN|nr:hypothetical protein [Legionella longbeachae]VEE04354.1 Uncharacterised protein [Legionella oakridgensis]HBD7397106.1 hypothetical protein [Legionella pneumophila]ARB92823.1 hypothetical protein A6J40_11840 [Legionella longbeachae]ARM34012.1 hypothetical protein B0B39_10955 [Legionella longbeachae]QEY53075.1 hypothetical protein FQU71_18610 [Legionella longbeachae]
MSILKNSNGAEQDELGKTNQIEKIKEKLYKFLDNQTPYLKQEIKNDKKPTEGHLKNNSEENIEEKIKNILKNIEQIETKLAKLK